MTQRVNPKYKKIAAFTVIDMITGMVIMSIIMSLVFFIFSSFTKQVNDYSKSRANLVALNLLKIEIEQNIIRAEKVIEVPQGFATVNPNAITTFLLLEKNIVKTEELVTDTIYDNVSKMTFTGEADQNNIEADERVTKVSIKVLLSSKELTLNFYKRYSNQAKINYAILNEIR